MADHSSWCWQKPLNLQAWMASMTPTKYSLDWSQAEHTVSASRYQSSLGYSHITWRMNLSSHIFFHLSQYFHLILNNWCNANLLLEKKNKIKQKENLCQIPFKLHCFYESKLLLKDLQTMCAHVRVLDAFLRVGQTEWLNPKWWIRKEVKEDFNGERKSSVLLRF